MDPDRIATLRTMADRLAAYIHEENDQRLFRLFLQGGNRGHDYQELRNQLIRSDYAAARRKEPLFSLDEFLAVFALNDDPFWWLLARDLLLIRMIEQLHASGWIAANREAITPPEAATEDTVSV